MKIKVTETLTHHETGRSFTARPNMGVIKHFPARVCRALIKLGAVEVKAKTPRNP